MLLVKPSWLGFDNAGDFGADRKGGAVVSRQIDRIAEFQEGLLVAEVDVVHRKTPMSMPQKRRGEKE
jgi:hypothetical protein